MAGRNGKYLPQENPSEESTMEKALISIGSDMPEFIDHIIKLAFIKNN